jgi:hypothetical protein
MTVPLSGRCSSSLALPVPVRPPSSPRSPAGCGAAAGALSGGQPINWPAFGAAWLAVAHGVAQSGLPTVLLGPFVPGNLDELPARRWIADIHFIVLDCPDELRRARIRARPPWRSHDIEEQVEFGQWLRRNITDRVDTSSGTPEGAAAAVADWIELRLT